MVGNNTFFMIFAVFDMLLVINTNCSCLLPPLQQLFPGQPGLPSSPQVFFVHLFWKRTFGEKWHRLFIQAGRPSCHPTNSVKALKETQSTGPNQWPGLILSSFSTRLLTQGALLPLCWLSDASTYHNFFHAIKVSTGKLLHIFFRECRAVFG